MPSYKTPIRRRLFSEQNGICHYCECRMTMDLNCRNTCTVDHITPKAAGGGYIRENVVGACWLCNNKRGNMDYGLFMKLVKAVGSPAYFPDKKSKRAKLRRQVLSGDVGDVAVETIVEPPVVKLRRRILKEESRTVRRQIIAGGNPWNSKPSSMRKYVADLPKHEGVIREAMIRAGIEVDGGVVSTSRKPYFPRVMELCKKLWRALWR